MDSERLLRGVFGFLVFMIAFLELGGPDFVIGDDLSLVLFLLAAGYLAYSLTDSRIIAGAFSLICVVSGVLLIGRYSPLPLIGAALIFLGAMMLLIDFREGE